MRMPHSLAAKVGTRLREVAAGISTHLGSRPTADLR